MAGRKRPTFRAILESLSAKCVNCGTNQNLTINHKLPLAMGGTNEASNLEVLCETCHRKFHGLDRSLKEMR